MKALIDLNNRFYRDNRESFSASRQGTWPGWERVAEHLVPGALLDVACGNLRFERFLDGRFGAGSFDCTCLDSCAGFAEGASGIRFVECDVIAALMAGEGLPGIEPGSFDCAVSFGFMHHVPTSALREALVRALVGSVRPGGVAALSFWRFADDAKLAAKARETTARALNELGLELEDGDYLLGWNDVPGAWRYCHSFSGAEVDALVRAVSGLAEPAGLFEADGRTGALNAYLVLRRL